MNKLFRTSILLTFFELSALSQGNTLVVSPGALSFAYQLGASSPPEQYLTVNSSGAALSYVATSSSSAPWLQIQSGAVESTPNGIGISVAPTGLAIGTYTGTVTVAASGASNTPVDVQVTLIVSTNVLAVAPSALTFTYQLGASNPASQSISVESTGNGLTYIASVSANASWLQISSPIGATPANINVNVNASGLAPGAYSASIQVTSSPPAQWSAHRKSEPDGVGQYFNSLACFFDI